MNLKTEKLSIEVNKILDENNISPEELANMAGISKATIYRIINLKSEFSQRAVARKIAESTGRILKIEGDKVTFEKQSPQIENPDLLELLKKLKENQYDLYMSEEKRVWLQCFDELDQKTREEILVIVKKLARFSKQD